MAPASSNGLSSALGPRRRMEVAEVLASARRQKHERYTYMLAMQALPTGKTRLERAAERVHPRAWPFHDALAEPGLLGKEDLLAEGRAAEARAAGAAAAAAQEHDNPLLAVGMRMAMTTRPPGVGGGGGGSNGMKRSASRRSVRPGSIAGSRALLRTSTALGLSRSRGPRAAWEIALGGGDDHDPLGLGLREQPMLQGEQQGLSAAQDTPFTHPPMAAQQATPAQPAVLAGKRIQVDGTPLAAASTATAAVLSGVGTTAMTCPPVGRAAHATAHLTTQPQAPTVAAGGAGLASCAREGLGRRATSLLTPSQGRNLTPSLGCTRAPQSPSSQALHLHPTPLLDARMGGMCSRDGSPMAAGTSAFPSSPTQAVSSSTRCSPASQPAPRAAGVGMPALAQSADLTTTTSRARFLGVEHGLSCSTSALVGPPTRVQTADATASSVRHTPMAARWGAYDVNGSGNIPVVNVPGSPLTSSGSPRARSSAGPSSSGMYLGSSGWSSTASSGMGRMRMAACYTDIGKAALEVVSRFSLANAAVEPEPARLSTGLLALGSHSRSTAAGHTGLQHSQLPPLS